MSFLPGIRAGRDGKTAFCTLLYSAADRKLREFLIDKSDLSAEDRAEVDPAAIERRRQLDHAKLARMVSYAYADRCRRNVILGYFGERKPGTCGRCDACMGQTPSQDAPPEPVAYSRARREKVVPLKPPPPQDQSLFEALKEKRLDLAREAGIPAFVVCHDQTLSLIAAFKPERKAELMLIKGIGAAKAEKYGEALLEVVRAHAGS